MQEVISRGKIYTNVLIRYFLSISSGEDEQIMNIEEQVLYISLIFQL